MALFGFGVVVAPVLGPTLGGWLTDSYSWRYAFYINIPVGMLAVYMISRFVHDPPYIRNAKAGPFDNLGFGLLILWTGCLQIILDKGQEDDWFGAPWIRWATADPRHLALLVHRPLLASAKIPSSNLHILRNRNFARRLPADLPCSASPSTSPSPCCRSSTRRCSATPRSPPASWSFRAALAP